MTDPNQQTEPRHQFIARLDNLTSRDVVFLDGIVRIFADPEEIQQLRNLRRSHLLLGMLEDTGDCVCLDATFARDESTQASTQEPAQH